MSSHFVAIQTVAAVVTALSALGVFGFAIQIYRLAKEHNRVLFGEQSVDGWDGLVGMVQEHRRALQEHDKL